MSAKIGELKAVFHDQGRGTYPIHCDLLWKSGHGKFQLMSSGAGTDEREAFKDAYKPIEDNNP